MQSLDSTVTDRKPRIVILNPWEQYIGPNRYLIELLRHSSHELLSTTLVVFQRQSEAVDEYRQLGIQLAIWPEIQPVFLNFSVSNLFRMAVLHTLGFARLVKHLIAIHPDVIISNTEMLIVSQWAARLLGVPHVQIFHAISFQYRLGAYPTLLRLYLRYMQFWNRYLIGVSQTLTSALVHGGVPLHKVATIPNPISDRESQVRTGNGIPTDLWNKLDCHNPILVTVGKLSPMKGQDLLVKALPMVKAHYPNFVCVFVGGVGASDGLDDTPAFATRLDEQITVAGLSENIVLLGPINYLPALLAKADLYVQPSRTESFGRVVAEALLGGTAVVAFDVGALPEVVGPGGVLIPFPDSVQMATRLMNY